jgi:ribosomal protein S18 acetylase RimI-like enzyme
MMISIETYRPEYQPCFERFNKDWLEEYFSVEPVDQYVLEQPEEAILRDGGQILFAKYNGEIVGTVALLKMEPGVFELTKMAVDKPYRGIGAGKFLCANAIATARILGAKKIILYSQSILQPAINIYKALGFRDIPLDHKYQRADVKMELDL